MQAKPSARGPVRPGRPLRPVPPRRRPLRRAPRQPRQNQQEVFAMLDQAFEQVYTKFKLHFYQQVFGRFENREATLTTVETFCMEVIMALGNPTVAEFSNLMHLSTPNASYKINNLVKKGYVEKVQSSTDKREYHLHPTKKYIEYYSISYAYLQQVVDRAKKRFTPEDLQKLEHAAHRFGRAHARNPAARFPGRNAPPRRLKRRKQPRYRFVSPRPVRKAGGV